MNLFPNWYLLAGAGVLLALVVLCDLPRYRERGGSWATVRHILLGLCLAVIALRPVFGAERVESTTIRADVVIMVDRTTSMGARDYAAGQPRITGVSRDVRRLVSRLSGARFAVVVFDNNARIEVPFTTDGMTIVSAVDSLGWREIEQGSGSDISVGVPEAEALLKESEKRDSGALRVLYYAGDGEQTAQKKPDSFATLKPLVSEAFVLGYGTTAGAPMLKSPSAKSDVMHNGKPALSKADPAALQTIADQLGGTMSMRDPEKDLPLPGAIVPTRTTTDIRLSASGEVYWIVAVLAGFIVAVEVAVIARNWRQARQEVRDAHQASG